MDQLEEENDSDHSVFSLISALCRNLSSNLENVDAKTAELHLRSLRRIAFSHLLKRSTVIFEENQCFTENIPLALFTLVASKKSSKNEWSPSEYTKTCMILDKLDRSFSNASEPSWMCNIGRMLIALELHRPQQATTSKNKCSTWSYELRSIDGLACIPKQFQPSTSQFLTDDISEGFSLIDYLWTHFKSQLGSFQLPKRMDTIWIPKSCGLAIEQNDAAKGLPRSVSRVDEGFSSPTDAGAARSQPFDWSIIPTKPKILHLEWESFSNPPEGQYVTSSRGRTIIHRDIKFCPNNLVKVSFPELVECIKALLLGVSSHIFEEINGEFCMTPGLYTDETPPSLMYVYCKTFRKGGMLFSKLTRLSEDYISLTSASMSVVIQNFILDYQAFIKSIPISTALLKLTLAITPFITQLEYLVGLVESNTGGWQLLEKLYDDALQMVDDNSFRLSSALFLDCYTTYLTFIEKWIFDGQWHPELFFEKHISLEDICDRYSWARSYTFNLLNAPLCLPSADIYECGKLVHLVQNRTSSVDEKSLAFDCRPKIRMVTDMVDFMSMKHLCHFYSHIGDGLRLEALQTCKHDYDFDLSSASKDKADADSFKYCIAKAAERERILSQKLDNVMKIKQQLANSEEHLNIEELKRSLFELLEADRLTYYEIENFFSSFPYRYELIEQYIKNEECCAKRSFLNFWKEKRYNLNSLRTLYFARYLNNTESGPFVLRHVKGPDTSLLHAVNDDANIDSPCKPLPSATTISLISNKLPMASTPRMDSVNQSTSDITFLIPVEHHLEDEKILSSDQSESSFFTCSSQDAMVISPVTCEITNKSPTDGYTSDLIKVSSEDETSKTVEDAFDKAEYADLSEMSSHPSPDSLTNASPYNLRVSFSKYCENLGASNSQPNISSSEIKTKMVGSLVNRITTTFSHSVNHDYLKPFKYIENYYDREDNAGNVDCNLAASSNNLQHEISMNEFSKSHFHFLVSKSIDYPLQAQTRVMNNLAVHKLFVENDLIGHFKRMRDVFLKNNGSGAQIFANMLCRHIDHDDPLAFKVHHKLQNILYVAYPTESKYLALKTNYIPQAFDSTNPNVFCFLRLCYSRNWPLNLVITDMALLKYNEIFEFITRIDLTLVYLQQVFQFLRVKFMELGGDNFTQIQLHRHIMLTFLNSLKFYTGTIITDSWNQMYNDLHTVHDPDQLYRVHVKFLKNLHNKLLLNKTTERVQECLSKALHYVLVYCQTILHADWKISETGQCTHAKYKKLLHTFANFKEMVFGSQKLVKYYIIEQGYVHLKILCQSMNC